MLASLKWIAAILAIVNLRVAHGISVNITDATCTSLTYVVNATSSEQQSLSSTGTLLINNSSYTFALAQFQTSDDSSDESSATGQLSLGDAADPAPSLLFVIDLVDEADSSVIVASANTTATCEVDSASSTSSIVPVVPLAVQTPTTTSVSVLPTTPLTSAPLAVGSVGVSSTSTSVVAPNIGPEIAPISTALDSLATTTFADSFSTTMLADPLSTTAADIVTTSIAQSIQAPTVAPQDATTLISAPEAITTSLPSSTLGFVEAAPASSVTKVVPPASPSPGVASIYGSTPAEGQEKTADKSDTPTILGASLGSAGFVLLLVAILACVFSICRRKRREKSEAYSDRFHRQSRTENWDQWSKA